MKELFLLDPDIIYLNHGSFGACPRPVFDVYQSWQHELEKQPVEFLDRRFIKLLLEARSSLANFLNADPDNLVFFPNPTTALNMVMRSLISRQHPFLLPGDEILITDHEYGAIDRLLRYICRQSGARLIRQPLPLPLNEAGELLELFWKGVTLRTKVILISHITSPTTLILPVETICRRAHNTGILTVIDGAHAPGQIPVNLEEIGADIYAGACHKWLCAPKGSGFLYARHEIQNLLDPLVVSWGYESDNPSHSQFLDFHQWQGTRDIAAYLSVAAAIEFQEKHEWKKIRETAHLMAVNTRQLINAITGCESLYPDGLFSQMVAIKLPTDTNAAEVKKLLWNKYKIEIPLYEWRGQKILRLSVQAYNTQEDLETLYRALEVVFR